MLFNSCEYLVFFLVVCHASWWLVERPRLRLWMLLLASLYFYVSNNGWQIVWLLISTQIDYLCGIGIADSRSPRARKLYLAASLCGNLGLLAYFKYGGFFSEMLISLGQFAGWNVSWPPLRVVLPVGISFYTFQTMSYTIDVYRGDLPAERSWLRFAFYVTYFPQLIAGPIVRAADFVPQIAQRPMVDATVFERSVALIFRGLLKKIVLADGLLASHVDIAFSHPAAANGVEAWLGLFAFAFQIYFDFSGYSDVAIGCSRLMGYHIPDNFNLPYTADSFSDFWRRWHISLSTWLRDYLYVPLGGNRMPTQWGVARNLMLVMVLGGLWHGAAWNFVIWGAMHGSFLLIERLLGMRRVTPQQTFSTARLIVHRAIVMVGVLAAWVVFRAATLADISAYAQALTCQRMPALITAAQMAAMLVIAGSWMMQYVGRRGDPFERLAPLPLPLKCLGYAIAAVMIIVFNSGGPQPFIYFQF